MYSFQLFVVVLYTCLVCEMLMLLLQACPLWEPKMGTLATRRFNRYLPTPCTCKPRHFPSSIDQKIETIREIAKKGKGAWEGEIAGIFRSTSLSLHHQRDGLTADTASARLLCSRGYPTSHSLYTVLIWQQQRQLALFKGWVNLPFGGIEII